MSKLCTKCKEVQELSEFYKDRGTKDGYSPHCKECKAAYQKRYYEKNPDKYNPPHKKLYQWQWDLKRQYNIDVEDYAHMMNDQGCACATCGEAPDNKALSVDHCHTTGKVRGLLCTKCNFALGYVNDDVQILTNLINYLKGNEHA